VDDPVIKQKINAAETVALVLREQFGDLIDSSYLAGSITAGLGNPTSDADVFVLYDGDRAPGGDLQQFSVDGHRVDVEWYPVARLEGHLDSVLGWRIGPDNLAELWKFADRLDFLARFATSRAVQSSSRLDGAYQRIEADGARLRQTTINYWALAVNSDLEDFHGACLQQDLGTATYAGQVLLTSAGKAVTTAAGDRYFNRKWVYRQIERTLTGGFPTGRFAQFQRGDWTAGGLDAARELLEFAQTCVAASQLLSGADCGPEHWPTWDFGTEGLYRNTAYNVLHLGDRVLLHRELHRQVTLKPEVAFVWALCQGSTPNTIVARIRALAETVPALAAMNETRINGILDALVRRGLADHRRSEPFGPGGA
jgi:hypothetical protein